MARRLIVIADSSAWIAYLRGDAVLAASLLDDALDRHRVLMADLVLVEIMRGLDTELEAKRVLRSLRVLPVYEMGGESAAIKSAEHYRLLRSKGKTVRGAIDLLLATWCIENEVPLLHADRDFSGFEEHLGLKRWGVEVTESQ